MAKKKKLLIMKTSEVAKKFLRDSFFIVFCLKDKAAQKRALLELRCSPEYRMAISKIGFRYGSNEEIKTSVMDGTLKSSISNYEGIAQRVYRQQAQHVYVRQ